MGKLKWGNGGITVQRTTHAKKKQKKTPNSFFHSFFGASCWNPWRLIHVASFIRLPFKAASVGQPDLRVAPTTTSMEPYMLEQHYIDAANTSDPFQLLHQPWRNPLERPSSGSPTSTPPSLPTPLLPPPTRQRRRRRQRDPMKKPLYGRSVDLRHMSWLWKVRMDKLLDMAEGENVSDVVFQYL